jgi:hypothetical protein
MRREQVLPDSKDGGLTRGFFVDSGTGRRLEELCREMTSSCGLI